MKNKYFFIIVATFLSILFYSCKKDRTEDAQCIEPAVVPFQPYSYPVWHPNGQLLGFTYTPLAGIGSNGKAPCIYYSYFANADSTGFYLMNKDGSSFRRVTNFRVYSPAWSPDGKWLAFSLGSNIFKMRYNAPNFDTANIIRLTNGGGNFSPSWTANSDTIYFDSNNTLPSGTNFYTIWKMASSDGSAKQRLIDATLLGDVRSPHVGSNTKIYFTQFVGGINQIFQMNPDGSGKIQYSNNGFDIKTPKYYQGKLFYEGNDLGVVNSFGGSGTKLAAPAITYDISTNGEIVYSKMYYSISEYRKQIGTLWIMNADGTNNHQLTFNNF